MIEWIHPGLLLILGAALVPFLHGAARKAYVVALAAAVAAYCFTLAPGEYGAVRFLGLDLVFGRVDRLSLVFSYVFTIMTLLGVIYSLHETEGGRIAAALVYAGSALGVVFAGDLLVLFVFWELMAFSSVFLIWQNRAAASLAAGYRYLLVHVTGGAVLLAGIVIHARTTGSLAFEGFGGIEGAGSGLILIGFLLNAAVPPLSAWLSDAYPEATVTGAVFLSAFTTKTAVYVLLRGFAGNGLLMWLGAFMALYGVVYAVLQDNPRRLLTYHIISQVGYMVCAVGIGTPLALNGSTAHAFAHILYKGLLFMAAGAVIHVTGKRRLSEMGGLHRTMPLTFLFYMVGAFSISALPLTSGFVSKSMVTAGAADAGQGVVFLMLTAASAGTFLSVGLKLPWFMFFGRDARLDAREPPANMLAAMGLASLLCVLIGIYPEGLYRHLPWPSGFHPYTAQHLVSTLELLLFTGVGFAILRKALVPKPAIALDTDWFYRRGAAALMWLVRSPLATLEFRWVVQAHERVLGGLRRLAPQARAFDVGFIDRSVECAGRAALAWGDALRSLQNGQLSRYALVMALGLAAMLFLALVVYL